jgi:hypothetical protein
MFNRLIAFLPLYHPSSASNSRRAETSHLKVNFSTGGRPKFEKIVSGAAICGKNNGHWPQLPVFRANLSNRPCLIFSDKGPVL